MDEKGAGVNDLPGAGQSRAPARPQAGESAAGHQKKLFCRLDKRAFSMKSPLTGLMKNEDAALIFPAFCACVPAGNVIQCVYDD